MYYATVADGRANVEQGGQDKVVGQYVGQSEAGEREAAHVMHAERRDDQTEEDGNKEKSVPLSEDYYIDRYNTVAEIATEQMCSQHFVSQETLAKLEEYYPSYRNGLIKRLEKVTNLTESDRQAILKKNHIERAKFVPSKNFQVGRSDSMLVTMGMIILTNLLLNYMILLYMILTQNLRNQIELLLLGM